ncbi:MAG: HupE/UreJ family protein [Chitinophagaceae bacterium]
MDPIKEIRTRKRRISQKYLLPLLLLIFLASPVFAHDVVGELENMSSTDTAFLYLKLGYKHILPLGLDHILFVLSLFLLSSKLKPVLWQSLAFTVAHSITLGLAMYKVITVPPSVVEPLIALSIMYVALENVFIQRLRPSRVGVVFIFGLVHGLGFASALNNLGLPQNSYLGSLVMFNVGVELGQLTVIILAFLLFGKWFGKKTWYRSHIVIPLSLVIAAIALYWVIERTLL